MTQLSPAPISMLDDLRQGIARPRLWWFLARRELAKKYDRSVLGWAWIPINTAIHIAVLGYIFSKLMGGDKYMPHFAIGFAVWTTFARSLNEAANLWPSSQRYILHLPMPLSVFVIKQQVKVVLMLLLSLPIGLAFTMIDGVMPGQRALLAIPGLVLWCMNLNWIIVLLSVLGVRYRDLGMGLPNLIFIAYLATPIIWEPSQLGEHEWIAQFNPMFHFIEVIRAPILGELPTAVSWTVGVSMAVVGNAVAFGVLAAVRRKIVLWL